MHRARCFFLLCFFPLGCVQRVMNVQTQPAGAVVYLNDREIGRTPFKKNFLWYGNYDVVVRKDGYKTLKTTAEITAPFWQWVPLDAVTDFLPLHDEETVAFTLTPDVPSDPDMLMKNGQAMQQDLESSEHTIDKSVMDVHAATKPTTQPTTGPATTQAG